MDDLVIGIDLGTTNSCISLCTKKQIKVLENPLGDRTTPSFIYFEPDGGIVIGKHASKISISRPENGIYEMKRLVGRKYDDRHLQKSTKYLSYTVKPSASNFPVISFKQKNYIVKKTPQELYTVFLKELKKYAEIKLKQPINKAVITVPAYFNVQQREVTLAAAKDAGFNVLKLLNEPTAAALAYYYKQNDIDNIQRSLVYDLGGGTFDIAVLEKQGKHIKVICVGGHAQLGGHDLDNCLLEHVCQQLKRKYRYDVENPDDKSMLRTKCEQAKKELSTAEETVIVINGLVPEHRRIKIVITRDQFEDLADDLFEKTIFILDCCLRNSNISKESIKEVILSGGCTRIPKIHELLTEFFDGKKLSKFVNPDECVAEGAALQAAMLSTSQKQEISRMEMVDVIPFSLGFKSLGHKMSFILKKNKKIPASATQVFHTNENNQRSMSFRIYEGESLDATKNRLLGTFIISDLTLAPSGKVKIIVTFNIDNNCMITATAEEKFGKNMKQLIINYNAGDLLIKTRENLDSLAESVEDDENDKKFQNFVQSKCYLIEYSGAVMYNLEKKKLKKKHKEVFEICKMYKEMAEDMETDSENHLKLWISKCKEQCQTLVEKHKFKYMPAIIF